MSNDDLKFEYQELVREKHKNFDMSYRIMSIMVPASFVILGIMIEKGISINFLVVMSIVVVALWASYGIDRRLTFMNKIKNIRLRQIETQIGGIWIQRLNHYYKKISDVDNLPKDFNNNWKDEIKNLENEKKCICGSIEKFFINKRIHSYFKIYNIFFTLIWLLLIINRLI